MTALSVKLYDRSPYFVLFFCFFFPFSLFFFSLERNSPTSFDIEKKGRRAPGHYSWLIFHRGNPRYLIFDISRSRIERIGLRLSPVSYSLRAFVFDARRYFFCWRSFHETTQGARDTICNGVFYYPVEIYLREKEIERKSEGERVGDAAPETVAARELVSESLDERKRFCISGPKVDSYLPVSHKNILCYPQYERTKRV